MLLLLLFQMAVAVPTPTEQPSFTAFDCDKPTEINVARIPIDCQHSSEDLKLGSRVNISLWQEASEDFLGVLCKVERTEWMFYCGVWSHQSLVAPGKTMRPEKVTVEACRRMHQEGIWQDRSGREHKVMGEGLTFTNYVEAGSLSYYDNKVTCQGKDVQTEGGERYQRVVKLVDLKVEVRQVVVKPTAQGYDIPETFTTIRFQEVQGGGVMRDGKGTLVLDLTPPRSPTSCNLMKLGHLTVQASAVRGQGEFLRVLFSREHKLYLLQKNRTKEATSCAGHRFWETNLPGILVRREATRGRGATKARESWAPRAASLANHITELTDYTTAELRLELEHARLRETCLRYLNSLQDSSVGFQPGQGAGTITEVKGEVATSITCSPVSVRAREQEPNCYFDMPVRYLGEERYLEPISRILKGSSRSCPCGEAPTLMSQDNRLFRLDPGLTRVAEEGQKLMKEKIALDTVAGKGVYPAEALATAQRLLSGRWKEEVRRKGSSWNLSEPVWHPSPGVASSSWSWEQLFTATSWLTLGSKISLGVGVLYLTVQAGMWVAGALGVWKGIQTAAPSQISSRLMKMARALICGHYFEGVLRGGRAQEREQGDLGGVQGQEEDGRNTFTLAKDT